MGHILSILSPGIDGDFGEFPVSLFRFYHLRSLVGPVFEPYIGRASLHIDAEIPEYILFYLRDVEITESYAASLLCGASACFTGADGGDDVLSYPLFDATHIHGDSRSDGPFCLFPHGAVPDVHILHGAFHEGIHIDVLKSLIGIAVIDRANKQIYGIVRRSPNIEETSYRQKNKNNGGYYLYCTFHALIFTLFGAAVNSPLKRHALKDQPLGVNLFPEDAKFLDRGNASFYGPGYIHGKTSVVRNLLQRDAGVALGKVHLSRRFVELHYP